MPEATSQAITLSEVTGCVSFYLEFISMITVYIGIQPFGTVCLMDNSGRLYQGWSRELGFIRRRSA
jgi:hypothetical protein